MNEFFTTYCPRCDRPYTSTTKLGSELLASKHMDGAHPDMDNPFKED